MDDYDSSNFSELNEYQIPYINSSRNHGSRYSIYGRNSVKSQKGISREVMKALGRCETGKFENEDALKRSIKILVQNSAFNILGGLGIDNMTEDEKK